MLLILMLTTKGMAGVPRASLVVIAATLNQFNIPEAGLLLILGIDTFLDMGRSATNVIGNSLATAVVAKWEGQLISDVDTMEMIEEMEVEPHMRRGSAQLRFLAFAAAWASGSTFGGRGCTAYRHAEDNP